MKNLKKRIIARQLSGKIEDTLVELSDNIAPLNDNFGLGGSFTGNIVELGGSIRSFENNFGRYQYKKFGVGDYLLSFEKYDFAKIAGVAGSSCVVKRGKAHKTALVSLEFDDVNRGVRINTFDLSGNLIDFDGEITISFKVYLSDN